MTLTHLSLFSGIGGLDIAAEKAGFKTVGQCEWADFPCAGLAKHWPNVPRWRDIRNLNKESFYERTGLRTIDVISGGFPCQPFSTAGQRRGTADDRYLWPEMLRIVQELRPTWVVGENVAGLISMVQSVQAVGVEGRSINRLPDGDHYEAAWVQQENMLLVELIGDLERIDYEVQAFVIPACATGAAHRRDRIALVAWNTKRANEVQKRGVRKGTDAEPSGSCEDVAYADGSGHFHRWAEIEPAEAGEYAQRQPCGCCDDVSNTDCDGRQGDGWAPSEGCHIDQVDPAVTKGTGGRRPAAQPGLGGVADGIPAWMDRYWLTEPDIPRVASGAKDRVNKLKAYGNAVYWPQFYPIMAGIYHIETSGRAVIPPALCEHIVDICEEE